MRRLQKNRPFKLSFRFSVEFWSKGRHGVKAVRASRVVVSDSGPVDNVRGHPPRRKRKKNSLLSSLYAASKRPGLPLTETADLELAKLF